MCIVIAIGFSVGGYRRACAGSLQVAIVDNLPGAFTNISATGATPGTPLQLQDDEETIVATTIGNIVFPSGNVVVANNGGLGFRNPANTDLAPINQAIPSNDAFGGGQSAMAFWDDIGDIDDKDDMDVFEREFADRYVVQWERKTFGMNQFAGEPQPGFATFQIQIFSGASQAGDIVAQFIYEDIEDSLPGPDRGSSATIGYQDGGAGFGNFPWSVNSAVLSNGTVLTVVLVPEPSTVMMMSLLLVVVIRPGRHQRRY